MIRTKILLGLITAVCMVAATTAPALAHNFNGEKGAMGKSSAETVFTTSKGGVPVKCEKTEYTASKSQENGGKFEKIELLPKYEGCTAKVAGITVKVVVTTKGTVYKLTITGEPSKGQFEVAVRIRGTVRLEIPVGTKKCEVQVLEFQTGNGHKLIKWRNGSTKSPFTSKSTEEVTEIAFESKGEGCKTAGIAEKATTGELKGTTEIKGVIAE